MVSLIVYVCATHKISINLRVTVPRCINPGLVGSLQISVEVFNEIRRGTTSSGGSVLITQDLRSSCSLSFVLKYQIIIAVQPWEYANPLADKSQLREVAHELIFFKLASWLANEMCNLYPDGGTFSLSLSFCLPSPPSWVHYKNQQKIFECSVLMIIDHFYLSLLVFPLSLSPGTLCCWCDYNN